MSHMLYNGLWSDDFIYQSAAVQERLLQQAREREAADDIRCRLYHGGDRRAMDLYDQRTAEETARRERLGLF